ncbi:MAG: CYTH domain-containing protein [Deltaproteobacteria bacterium]|nr:CYTH domain-containing protein [Deltaproteobacteria bacterium]
MAIEIERKFLLLNDSWRLNADAGTVMRQGYLSNNGKSSIRVRISGDRANLNIKSSTTGIVRREYEYAIALSDAEEMLADLCHEAIIEKVRYHVNFSGFIWEVDVFSGASSGLVVAEIELDELGQTFPRPEWLGREVSEELRYYNSHLAGYPYCAWSEAEKENL